MLKRLLTAFAVASFAFANIASSDSFIRDDILKLSYCNFNDNEMFVRIPSKPLPCSMSMNPCVAENPCNMPEPCEKKIPCNPCEKPKAGWTHGCHCDKHIKMLHEFFTKADCVVGLTPEQKQSSISIRKSATKEIIELKRDIATKESKILGLNKACPCDREASREINSLNRDIYDLKNDVEKVCKNAKKEYKRMLNHEQKRAFNEYNKQWKNASNIAQASNNIPCPCNK